MMDQNIFKNIHTLELTNNKNITDDGLEYIYNINTLELDKNENITDNRLKYISNIYKLKLTHNKNITDNGLKYISNIHTLKICCNNKITNKGLKNIPNIHILELYKNKYNSDVYHYYYIFENIIKHKELIDQDTNLKKIISDGKKYIPNIKQFIYIVN